MNNEIRGREISRFINGSYNLETYNGKLIHQHTKFALQQIQRHIVGKINMSEMDLVKINESSIHGINVPNSNLTPLLKAYSSNWKLVKRTEILPKIILIEFSSDQYTIIEYLPGVRWLGRHMAITPTNNPFKERIYTTVIYSTPNNTAIRNQLIDMYDKKINNQTIENYKFLKGKTQLTYPMIIKKYEGKYALSSFIQESNETDYTLTGPFDQGLGFTNSSNETYYFLLGGTTMPLLDLLYILLQKCIYTVIQTKFGKEEAEKFNPYQQDFNQIFGPNFRIKALFTLKNVDSFIGQEMCAKVLEICKTQQLNIFDVTVRFSTLSESEKTTSPYVKHLTLHETRFDKNFLKKTIEVDKNLGKIFICGPHSFIQDVHSALSGHVEKSKIIIV